MQRRHEAELETLRTNNVTARQERMTQDSVSGNLGPIKREQAGGGSDQDNPRRKHRSKEGNSHGTDSSHDRSSTFYSSNHGDFHV